MNFEGGTTNGYWPEKYVPSNIQAIGGTTTITFDLGNGLSLIAEAESDIFGWRIQIFNDKRRKILFPVNEGVASIHIESYVENALDFSERNAKIYSN